MIESLLSYGWYVAVILIVLGFVALVKGADYLVDGASAIAKRFGISDLVIGLHEAEAEAEAEEEPWG